MRALLVVNPHATTTTPAGRDVLTHALASELKLEVLETRYRGHAAEATADAVRDGVELVVAHGGDGTVNEVVNGLMVGSGADPGVRESWMRGGWGAAEDAPALAVVPGGSANVFARALGVPRDPMAATSLILDALDERRCRTVGLGHAEDRWFTFNAGLGWDAAAVARVEQARAAGYEASPLRYAATAFAQWTRELRTPMSMTVEMPGHDPVHDVRLAFISNTDTWTYLGSRAVRTNPGASFDGGLGVFGVQDLGAPTVARTLREMLRDGGDPGGRNVLREDSVPLVRITCDQPLHLQMDGDHLGQRSEIELRAVAEALRVVV